MAGYACTWGPRFGRVSDGNVETLTYWLLLVCAHAGTAGAALKDPTEIAVPTVQNSSLHTDILIAHVQLLPLQISAHLNVQCVLSFVDWFHGSALEGGRCRLLRGAYEFCRWLSMPITFGMEGSSYLYSQITGGVENIVPLHVDIPRTCRSCRLLFDVVLQEYLQFQWNIFFSSSVR
jgi:hypothetical protein